MQGIGSMKPYSGSVIQDGTLGVDSGVKKKSCHPCNSFNLKNVPTGQVQIVDAPRTKVATPWKINMEPTNHQFRGENDLPNLHDYVPC